MCLERSQALKRYRSSPHKYYEMRFYGILSGRRLLLRITHDEVKRDVPSISQPRVSTRAPFRYRFVVVGEPWFAVTNANDLALGAMWKRLNSLDADAESGSFNQHKQRCASTLSTTQSEKRGVSGNRHTLPLKGTFIMFPRTNHYC